MSDVRCPRCNSRNVEALPPAESLPPTEETHHTDTPVTWFQCGACRRVWSRPLESSASPKHDQAS